MKIIFGNVSVLDSITKYTDICLNYIYNFTSLFQVGQPLKNLIPPYNLGGLITNSDEEVNFDIEYCNYIFSNVNSFMELMDIVVHVYEGADIFILVDDDLDMKITFTESLIKLLQQRYGLICNYALSPEDVSTIVDTDFSLDGLYNLDNDKLEYMKVMVNTNG